ncbi:hypothetical protein QTP70_022644, partial [Hemibagrus guttatus]
TAEAMVHKELKKHVWDLPVESYKSGEGYKRISKTLEHQMMCEVMPTISEAEVGSNGGGQGSGSPHQSDSEGHFESLMVSMLEERDRLLDTLRETQENLGLTQGKLHEVSHERDALQRQLNSALPQVSGYHTVLF